MQAVSSTFKANTVSSSQFPTYGILISWLETINTSYSFFTIGTSTIGGVDVIKGAGSSVTFLDRYQYTDYSTYGMSVDVNQNLGQYPYGTTMAVCTIKLENTSQIFTPGNDPTIGNYILPNRPVKFTVGFASDINGTGREDIAMFAGYSNAPDNDILHRETTLTCYDGMNYLNMTPSTGSGPLAAANGGVYVNTYAHLIIADLMQEAGFSSSQYVIEQSLQQPIGFLAPINFSTGTNVGGDQGSIGYIISALCEAELGLAFFDEAGVFHFWNRQHIPNNQTVQWKFDYNESLGGGNNTGIVDYTMENTSVINDVVVVANPRSVQPKQQVYQLAQGFLVPAGSTAQLSIDFSDENGPLPVTSVDAPTYGGTTSNYSTNLNQDGSSTVDVHSYISVYSTALKGSNYLVTFQNTYTQPIYISALNLFGTPAKVTMQINQEFSNNTSIGLYGINPANNGLPVQIQNDLIQSPDTARSIAYQLVTDYKLPQQRLVMEVMSVPQIQFGDYVTVTLSDIGKTNNYTVVGKSFTLSKDDPFKQVLELEIKQMVNYFTIGSSLIGGTDQIAP